METEILSTKPVRHMIQLSELAWRKRQMVIYSGRTGIGKSDALARVSASNHFPKIMLRCRATTRNSEILNQIALHFGVSRGNSNRYLSNGKLYSILGERLRDSGDLIAIDEADRLADSTFEMLRDFFDEYGVGMLLVGNENLEPKIDAQLERLARRIYRFHETDLKQPELFQVLEAKGYRLGEDEMKLLWDYCGGSPGWALAVLRLADEIAARNGVERCARDVLGAMKIIPKPRRGAAGPNSFVRRDGPLYRQRPSLTLTLKEPA